MTRALLLIALLVTGCERGTGKCVDSVSSSPATSIRCSTGQYLARVCAPEPEGPCELRCVAPVAASTP